jgi:PhzF family phenazine biosynthesis protein
MEPVEILRYTAFSRTPEGGNPAGIVPDARALDEPAMQRIATALGYSETAFLHPQTPGTYRVRYFSPVAEVPFCGHATIASAVALADRGHAGALRLLTAAGPVGVDTVHDGSGFRATLTSVEPQVLPAAPELVDTALHALRWSPAELDPGLPARIAFAGARHLVLAAASRERLAALDYAFDELRSLMLEHDLTTVLLVWQESSDRFHVRNPFPVGGVVEDPATGAAAAAFGAYLRTLGRVAPPAVLTLHQGKDMGRPSELVVRVPATGGIEVSGHAVAIEA